MKKFVQYFMLVAMVAAAACQKISEIEDERQEYIEKEVVIRATHELDGNTKTVLKEDGSVWWRPGDAIGVFFGKYCSPFIAYNMEEAASAYFIGNALIVQGNNENSTGISGKYTYWGVFPCSLDYADYDEGYGDGYWEGNSSYDDPERKGESLDVSIPVMQIAKAGSFDPWSFVSIAKSDNYNELAFYNVCGGVGFCLESEGVHTVTFRGNASEPIAGRVNVVMNNDSRPEVAEVINGQNTVTLAMAEGEYFVPGEWYYITLLPTALDQGYTMTFYKDSEVAEYKSSSPVEVKRSVFGKITNPDSGLQYEEYIPAKNVMIGGLDNYDYHVGETLQLSVEINPSNCTLPVEWSTSDPSKATVSEEGLVKFLSEGEVKIMAKVGNVSTSRYVHVGAAIPSFTITSLDFKDVRSLASISFSDEHGEFESLCKVDNDGNITRLAFNFETDDERFRDYVEKNVFLRADESYWISDKYIVFRRTEFVSLNNPSDSYSSALSRYFNSIDDYLVVRAKDGVIMSLDCEFEKYDFPENDYLWQQTYSYSRMSYSGDALYVKGSFERRPYEKWIETGNTLSVTYPFDFSGSKISLSGEYGVLLDKYDNILATGYDYWYILHNDNSVSEFERHNVWLSEFVEVDYKWYAIESYDYGDGNTSIDVYTIEEEQQGQNIMNLVTSVAAPENWYTSSETYYRRGNTFIFCNADKKEESANVLTVEIGDKVSVNYLCVSGLPQDMRSDAISPDGYYYTMVDGDVYVYDLMTGECKTLNCDRSNVPEMTSTVPEYDSNVHCFYESGTRLSDSKTVTVVTDCRTGMVTVYDEDYHYLADSYIVFPVATK